MLLGHSRFIGWFRTALVVATLNMVLFGSTIDLVHNHLPISARSETLRLEAPEGPIRPHFESDQSAESLPCNACFFEKVLSQSVIPWQCLWIGTDGSDSVQPIPASFPYAAERSVPVSRGPPFVDFQS